MEHLVHSRISSRYITSTSYTLFNALIASIIIITASFPIPPRYFVSHSVKRDIRRKGTIPSWKPSQIVHFFHVFPLLYAHPHDHASALSSVREIMVTNSANLSKIFITTGFHAQWGALRYALRFRLSRSHLFASSTLSTRACYFIVEHSISFPKKLSLFAQLFYSNPIKFFERENFEIF